MMIRESKPIHSRGSWKVRHWIALSDGEDCSPDWQDFVATMALLLILMDSLASEAQACRNGQWSEIDLADLVPGDIVAFKIGDVAPGDCCLYDAVNVSIDQWMVHRKLNSMHLRSLHSLTQPKSRLNKRTFLESKTTDSGKGKGKRRARDDKLSHPLAGAHRVKHLNHHAHPGEACRMIIQCGITLTGAVKSVKDWGYAIDLGISVDPSVNPATSKVLASHITALSLSSTPANLLDTTKRMGQPEGAS
ncbi:hypothetical protein PCASD_23323 [Puccinia coronata f. sp. avenae]|uniref:P-type ATPase A domain-containing protein n=1 Tax=Puccinia coronata f. sp. avenae TaxID=200324 RepID=A0A2N5RVS6_9BASI|nr:hypothetical protein PCASD_23323 [Puccinia coronata f. sp. avenae]